MLMAAAEAAKLCCRAHQSAAPPAPSHSSRHRSCRSTAARRSRGGDVCHLTRLSRAERQYGQQQHWLKRLHLRAASILFCLGLHTTGAH